MNRQTKGLWILGLTLGIVLTIGCNAPVSRPKDSGNGESATSGEIYITVDENFRPVIDSEINVFQNLYPKAKIHAVYLPGEEAIKRMISSDSFRLALVTRNLSIEEDAFVKSQKATNRPMPIAIDAIAMIAHKDNRDSVLTTEQYRGILTGKITQWKQINPASALGEILLVYDDKRSGTVTYIKDSILKEEKLSEKAYTAKGSPEVLDYVAKTPNAIGILGVNWVSDSDDKQATGFLRKVKIIGVESTPDCKWTSKYVKPYQGLIKAECYPISRYLYSLNRESGFRLGTGFVSFLCNGENGQRVILKSGLVPYYAVTRNIRIK
ncbi:MAG: substrate-binding domain-containing protein [Bacteroidia bacterium]|nr:substrate-binding domain-containing protein [Bacteroidia bacterium]